MPPVDSVKRVLILCFGLLFCQEAIASETYYVDAKNINTTAEDGSRDRPWKTVTAALKSLPKKGGDQIVIATGLYKTLLLRDYNFDKKVTVRAAANSVVKFDSIYIDNSTNIRLVGFSVSPSFGQKQKNNTIVFTGFGASNIELIDLTIFSEPSIKGWSKEDWNARAVNGIWTRGGSVIIDHAKIYNIAHGISLASPNSKVLNSTISNFSGDGIRGLGDNSLYENNTIKNCYQVNGNHPDGFQSWSYNKSHQVGKSVVRDVVIRKNLFLNATDPNQPFQCEMQGIGLFDGFYENWRIENNIIVTNHWHGISVYGARNVRILNNTVLDLEYGKPGPPWISIFPHKDGRPSNGNVIANNLATAIPRNKGALYLRNQILRNPEYEFTDIDKFDYTLREDSRAIDAGYPFPEITEDFFGNPRPSGKGIDVGAVEFQ